MQPLIRILSILLAVLLLTMVAAFLMPGSDQPTSRTHPRFDSMLQGTENLAEQPGALVVGTVMALVMVAIQATFVLIGLQRRGRIGWLGRSLIGCFAAYALLFLIVIFSHAGSMQEVSFRGGFPEATAWMVYGLWLFPLLFVFLYMLMFESSVLSREDLEKFRAIQREHGPQSGRAP